MTPRLPNRASIGAPRTTPLEACSMSPKTSSKVRFSLTMITTWRMASANGLAAGSCRTKPFSAITRAVCPASSAAPGAGRIEIEPRRNSA
jgi:hypothetical protein